MKKSIIIITLMLTFLILNVSVFADTIYVNGIGEVSKDEKLEDLELNDENFWNGVLREYKTFIIGVTGLSVLTMVILFILNLLKLAKSGDNPNARSSALNGLLWTGLGTTGIGSIAIIVALSYNVLK